MADRREFDLALDQQRARQDAAWAGFERWSRFLGLRAWGFDVPAFNRLVAASRAVTDYRRAHNQRGGDYEDEILAVRVCADTFAGEIEAAAGDRDADTISWVVAGLRCPQRPFCTGCPACQTVTSPARPNVAPKMRY